jgi:hypothetical protein
VWHAAQVALNISAPLRVGAWARARELATTNAAPMTAHLISIRNPACSLEKIASDFFDTAPAFPAAKSAVFAACSCA